jgi:hypothetical protein
MASAEPVPSFPEATPPRKRRRRLLLLGLIAVVVLVGVVATNWYVGLRADRELQELVAEIDRSEPEGWRLHEIADNRIKLPDQRNSAIQILAVSQLLPPGLASARSCSGPSARGRRGGRRGNRPGTRNRLPGKNRSTAQQNFQHPRAKAQ